MKPAKKIEKLISKINVTPDAQKDKKTLDDILMAQEKTKSSANTQPNIWRIIMNNKITKLTAAAAIILVAITIINQFGGSIDGSSVAFAQMTEAIKKVPWIHVICHYDDEEGVKQSREQWFSFRSKTSAFISADSSIDYSSGLQRRWFGYDPETETLKIEFWDPSFSTTGAGTPFAEVKPGNFFDYYLRDADNSQAVVSHSTKVYDGKEFDVFEFEIEKEGYSKKVTLLTDMTTHLPERLDMEFIRSNKTSIDSSEIEYPEKGPESIYDLGVPLNTKKVVDWMPEDDLVEVWDKHRACRNDFYDATSKSIAVITEKSRAVKDGVWGDRMNRVTIEYKEVPQFCWYSYQLGEGMNYPDEPQTVDELPQSFEEILQWSKTVKLYPYYCGKRIATLWKDSGWSPRLIRWTWPIGYPRGYNVIEDDYSIENNLICIEKIQRNDAEHFEQMRKVIPDFRKGTQPSDTYDRFIYYLNPERDYICQRRVSEWRIKDNKPDSVAIDDVIEYDKANSGKWYAKKFKSTGFEGNDQTSESTTKIYLETDIDFPETVFDEKLDLPEYEPDVYVPDRN